MAQRALAGRSGNFAFVLLVANCLGARVVRPCVKTTLPAGYPRNAEYRRVRKTKFLCAAFKLGHARRCKSCLGNGWLGRVVIADSGEGRPWLGQALP
jgi:hypothetical protein